MTNVTRIPVSEPQPAATAAELRDGELDAARGASLYFGAIKFQYTPQKEGGTRD